ncbi:MAG: hypothetical protein HQK97_01500 [Nitrospirae bacterium]|nr:hypothetical protein [Nitrospirota bacterium]
MSKSKTMKRALASLTLVTVLVLSGLVWAGTASFTLPYLHSSSGLTTYCMVSNLNPGTSTDNTTSDTTGSFQVMATEKGGPTQAAHSIPASFTPKSGTMRFFVFRQNAIYNGAGAQVVSFSDEIPNGGVNGYAGILSFTSSTATCKTISIACMQSNTGDGSSGKRFANSVCNDGTNTISY